MSGIQDRCCGSECPYESNEEEQKVRPCWGDVTAVDESYNGEDSYWIHACDGHADVVGYTGLYQGVYQEEVKEAPVG